MSIQLELLFPPDERWEIIPGYDGVYRVSNLGQLERTIATDPGHPPCVLKGAVNSSGYLITALSKDGKPKNFYIHRLVALAFYGECPKGQVVNHINGVKTDNRLSNLEYVTQKQNISHSINVLGNSVSGTDSAWAKFTDDDIRNIRRLYTGGLNQVGIARMYQVTKHAIHAIVHGKTWKHVTD